MSGEPAILGRIREAVEAVVPPADAARVLLDALGRWGPRVPVDVEEVGAFVEGPLTAALGTRIDAARTLRILRSVDEILANAAAPTQQHRAPSDPAPEDRAPFLDEATATIARTDAGPVPVLVVAGGRALAARLRLAMGPERIASVSRHDRAGVLDAVRGEPLLVIVDGTDVPRLSPDELSAALLTSPAHRIAWGSDTPYGRRFLELCDRDARACAAVRIADGMDVILDLIASRRG